MIKHLRNIDRLYFGQRVGRGSALSAVGALMCAVMPWAFVQRYISGDLDGEIERLCA